MKKIHSSEIEELIQDLKNSLEMRKDEIHKLHNDLALKDDIIAKHRNDLTLSQLQLYQAQEELKDELELSQLQLQQAKDELQNKLELSHLQLLQAQEELSANTAYRNYMEKWKREVAYSFKGQFQLFAKTFLYRVLDWSRWHVPIRLVRPFKKWLHRISTS